ncbi:MAG: hypothetical protein ACRCWQ_14810 [Bacilli bacterium]
MEFFKDIYRLIFSPCKQKDDNKVEELDDIVSGINSQIIKLTKRVEKDNISIEQKTKQQEELAAQKVKLTTDIERATRIKSRFEESIK